METGSHKLDESEKSSKFGHSHKHSKLRQDSFGELEDMTNEFNLLNKNLEYSDFVTRLIGIVLAIKENDIYEVESKYKTLLNMKIPLSNLYYEEKTQKVTYTQKDFPSWLSNELKQDSNINIINIEYKNVNVTIRKYAPVIFHFIMRSDDISISSILESLDPITNFKEMRNNFASGGRSANPILFTHDKKYLIKTVSKDEKNVFVKMLPEFHSKMVKEQSLLCRIYGMFKVKIE